MAQRSQLGSAWALEPVTCHRAICYAAPGASGSLSEDGAAVAFSARVPWGLNEGTHARPPGDASNATCEGSRGAGTPTEKAEMETRAAALLEACQRLGLGPRGAGARL